MLRYFLIIFSVVCVAVVASLGWQGKKSKNQPIAIFDDMDHQARYGALGKSEFAGFEDGRNARPPVAGTVARGSAKDLNDVFSPEYKANAVKNVEFATGKDASGKFIEGFPKYSLSASADGKSLAPYSLDAAILANGKKKYDIYCAICHGHAGDGNGIMKKRVEVRDGEEGIAAIANLQDSTFRAYSNGQLYDVIAHGAKTMLGYGDKLNPEERWAVVAYLRALQLSQNCPPELVPAGVNKANLK